MFCCFDSISRVSRFTSAAACRLLSRERVKRDSLVLLLFVAVTCGILSASSATASSTRRIAAGENHSIFVDPTGVVRAAGDNDRGQLGDGTNFNRSSPVAVLGVGITDTVAAGSYHSLAKRADGRIYAWGDNAAGQLGLSRAIVRTSRAAVMPGVQAIDMAAQGRNTVVIDAAGDVWLFGEATNGIRNRLATNLSPVGSRTSISLAGGIVGILLDNGVVRTVTYGNDGMPTAVSGPAVSSGQAIRGRRIAASGGAVYVVDENAKLWTVAGNAAEPAWQFDGEAVLDAGTSGEGNVAFLSTTGSSFVSGRNEFGQRGTGTTDSVVGFGASLLLDPSLLQVTGGRFHTLAMSSSGAAFSWGYSAFGALGNGRRQFIDNMQYSPSMNTLTAAALGRNHTLAVDARGALFAWGSNASSQIGGASTALTERLAPTRMIGFESIVAVAAANDHSLALRANGEVLAWGANFFGELAVPVGPNQGIPAVVSGLPKTVSAISIGTRSSFALTSDGILYAWGRNTSGELATGDAASSSQPRRQVSLPAGRSVRQFATGRAHGAAVANDGTLWVWGANSAGQLGGLTASSSTSMVQLLLPNLAPARVSQVAAGFNSTLALADDGSVWLWGGVALDNPASVTAPQKITGLPRVVKIEASGYSYAAIAEDGELWAWGYAIADTPKRILSGSKVEKLAGGAFGAALMALDSDARWWGVGYNTYGQLGLPAQGAVFDANPSKAYLAAPGASNSIEVLELFTHQIGVAAERYFLSADAGNTALLDTLVGADGTYTWRRTGRGFRAWLSKEAAPPNAVPVARFYCVFADKKPNTHFYTAKESEMVALRRLNPTNEIGNGCRDEGTAFFSIPTSPTGYVGPGTAHLVDKSCGVGFQPVYRAFNNRIAQNDGNHRMTTSFIDHLRSIRYLGFVDEGVGFCSPTSSVAGGDLHAYHSYPGAEVKAGDRIKAEYVFANNGPGAGNGASVSAFIPEGVEWAVTCAARLGASCPSVVNAQSLRQGVLVDVFPPGGTLSFTLTGTAPPVVGTNSTELRFANSIQAALSAPDLISANDTTRFSNTIVKSVLPASASTCSYALTVKQLSLSSSSGTATTTVSTNAGCALSGAVTSAMSKGLSVLPDWVTVSTPNGLIGDAIAAKNPFRIRVVENTGESARSAVITVSGRSLNVFQDGRVANPISTNCVSQLSPSAEHAAATGYDSRTLSVSTKTVGCTWEAKSDVDWIAVRSGASGKGASSVSYAVQSNPSDVARSGRIRINNTAIEIYQEATKSQGAAPGGDGNGGAEGGAGDGGGDGGSGGDGGDGGSAGGE